MISFHAAFVVQSVRAETNNLFALLSAVVRLVPSLVERAGLAGTLRDLMLLEVIAAET